MNIRAVLLFTTSLYFCAAVMLYLGFTAIMAEPKVGRSHTAGFGLVGIRAHRNQERNISP